MPIRLIGTLVAAADDRTLRYKLLPYGEPGLTNMGRVVASRGVLRLPDPAQFVVNVEHEKKRPAAVGVALDDQDDALYATIRALNTTTGNDLLEEAREGVRSGISVEVDEPLVRGGRLLRGALAAAGAVVEPAWTSAQLVAGAVQDAPDEGDDPDRDGREETYEDQVDDEAEATEDTEDTTEEEGDMPGTETETPTTEARVPALVASRTRPPAKAEELTLKGAADLMLAAKLGDTAAAARLAPGAQLWGALDNFVAADGAASFVPQWVDEVWSGNPYTRRIIPLLTPKTLTSMKINGWRWVTPPEVGIYSGLPAEITSTVTEIEPVTEDASRWAGGGRIDRRWIDFNDSTVLASYLSKLAESYARKTDAEAGTGLLTASTTVTLGTVPAGVSEGLAAIVDCALSFIDKATPSYAVVAKDVYRDILLMRSEDAMQFLSTSLGLDEGDIAGFRVVPFAGYAAGTVLVAARAATDHYELPGSPIRVNAQAIAIGAVDEAVFGYDDVFVNDTSCVASAVVI